MKNKLLEKTMTNKKTDLSIDNLTDYQKRNLDLYVGKLPGYTIDLCLSHEDAYNLYEALDDLGSHTAQRISDDIERALDHSYEENKLIALANQLQREGKLKKIIAEARKEAKDLGNGGVIRY